MRHEEWDFQLLTHHCGPTPVSVRAVPCCTVWQSLAVDYGASRSCLGGSARCAVRVWGTWGGSVSVAPTPQAESLGTLGIRLHLTRRSGIIRYLSSSAIQDTFSVRRSGD